MDIRIFRISVSALPNTQSTNVPPKCSDTKNIYYSVEARVYKACLEVACVCIMVEAKLFEYSVSVVHICVYTPLYFIGDNCFPTGVKKFNQNIFVHFQQWGVVGGSREFVNFAVHSNSG